MCVADSQMDQNSTNFTIETINIEMFRIGIYKKYKKYDVTGRIYNPQPL